MRRLHLPALLVLALPIAIASQACSESADTNQSTGRGRVPSSGTGGAGGGTEATVGAGGMGGSLPTGLTEDCVELCAYLDSIMCPSWDNCETECPAAPGCAAEYAAKIACWVENKADFQCSANQLLPPAQCQDEEEAFDMCFGTGTGGTTCMGQVCNSSGTESCSCKTSCLDSEYKSACAKQGDAFACSCYDFDKLLGTCVDDSAECPKDNYSNCCASYFFAQ